jgi:hypothetical protein
VQYANDLEWLGAWPVDYKIGVDEKKAMPTVGQIFTEMANVGCSGQLSNGSFDSIEYPVRYLVVFLRQIIPNLLEVSASEAR